MHTHICTHMHAHTYTRTHIHTRARISRVSDGGDSSVTKKKYGVEERKTIKPTNRILNESVPQSLSLVLILFT